MVSAGGVDSSLGAAAMRHVVALSDASPLRREFRAEHGRLPRWREWERATPTRPSTKAIERRWGWRELVVDAIGTRPNQIDLTWETLLDVRVQAMLAALAATRDELGRWPTAREWIGVDASRRLGR